MSDETKTEIEQAVEEERAAFEAQQSEKAAKELEKVAAGSGKSKGYIEQLVKDFDDNHLGDARRFSERFAGRLVFDNIQGRWYQYNCTHWFQDKGQVHMHNTTEIAEDYRAQSAYYKRRVAEEMVSPEYEAMAYKTDKKEHLKPFIQCQKAWAARAKELKDPTRVNKVLLMARVATPGYLGIVGDEWNQNPHLFACGDKVIDLRDGKALDPDPAFYINRASEIQWAGLNAECEMWDEFLMQVFNQDHELIDYIQKCVGYWMTGLMTFQEFYCLWGPQGRNGKGVFFRTLRKVMGSYFQMMPSKYLLDEKSLQNTDKPDQHLVSLEHTRLACVSESPKRAKFSESAIKQLSGGDPITCRGMYSLDVTEYVPGFKMLFVTNNIPSVNGDDKAFQDRLRVIKFPCTFKMGVDPDPKAKVYPRNPQLEVELHTPDNLSGIFAWCVRGAVEFFRTGTLDPPKSVLADTKLVMEDNDFIGEFIRECLDVHVDAPETNTPDNQKTQMKDIYDVFKVWSVEEKGVNKDKVLAMRTVGTDFRNRSDIFRVSPINKTFYNVTIKSEWRQQQGAGDVPF